MDSFILSVHIFRFPAYSGVSLYPGFIEKIHLHLIAFRFVGSDITSQVSFSISYRYSSSIAGFQASNSIAIFDVFGSKRSIIPADFILIHYFGVRIRNE